MATSTTSMPDPRGAKTSGATSSSSGTSVAKRLKTELMSIMMNPDKSVTAFPEGENLFQWVGTIQGSAGTVYEGLSYKLSLTFPSDYPYSPPTIKFITPCYHPNVDAHGNICLDILKEKWSAAYTVHSALLSLQTLLGDPNNDSPLNTNAAQLWDDQEAYRTELHSKYREATREG